MAQSRPIVECQRQTPCVQVPDVAEAVNWYTSNLGFTKGFTGGEPAQFAGVNLVKLSFFAAWQSEWRGLFGFLHRRKRRRTV